MQSLRNEHSSRARHGFQEPDQPPRALRYTTEPVKRDAFRGFRGQLIPSTINSVVMRFQNSNSHKPACWLRSLVCPRRYLAVLPSQARPNLFGSD